MQALIDNGLPLNELCLDNGKSRPLQFCLRMRVPIEMVQLMLARGAKVNYPPDDPAYGPLLVIAADAGRADLVTLFLDHGADIEAKDWGKLNAVHRAAGGGKPDHDLILKELMDRGAVPDADALGLAGGWGTQKAIQMIIKAGVDVNALSRYGTALHLAVDNDNAKGVQTLLSLGADPDLRLPEGDLNHAGKTAREVARKRKHKKVLPLVDPEFAAAAFAPRPPAPPLAEAWGRLEAALPTTLSASLHDGAAEAEVAAVEKGVKAKLPEDVRASYLRHNGQKDGSDGLFPSGFAGLDEEFCILPADAIAPDWKIWKELADGGEFEDGDAEPDESVRAAWWHKSWIPIASNGGGDSLCIDLSPAKGGIKGQVILLSHESGARRALARSLPELLAMAAEHWKAAGH
jgi:cell wall assembly regulator SMI1